MRPSNRVRKKDGAGNRPVLREGQLTDTLCACGCGRYTRAWKGRPSRYVQNHHPQPGKLKTPEDAFWPKVEKTEGCWLWRGSFVGAYGNAKFDRRSMRAHRLSWLIHHGPIPAGMFVCHRCDVPACVNPDHLFLGTPADNTADMWRKGRSHDRSGTANPRAKFTEADIREIRRLHATGVTQVEIGRRFGVHQAHISMIVRRKIWTEI